MSFGNDERQNGGSKVKTFTKIFSSHLTITSKGKLERYVLD
jgi:hypothetical protein